MRLLAIILNIVFLLSMAAMLYDKGLPRGDERLVVYLAIGTPVITLLAFLLPLSPRKESLVSLWLTRRKLEESERIRSINKSK
jgi:hypothetical protein